MESKKATLNTNFEYKWEEIARKFLKSELAKHGLSYGDLEARLASIGVQQSISNILEAFEI